MVDESLNKALTDATAGSVGPASIAMKRALAVTASARWDLTSRFPLIFDRASGPYVWDVDGKKYVDFTSCSGAAPLGAGHPDVERRVITEMRRSGGIFPGTLTELRTSVAERLIDLFPSAERAIFFRTGSCATTAAVRLARVFTGRRLVLTSGFHGWHDWQLQYKPEMDLADRDPETVDFAYDLDRLEDLLTRQARKVAAVIVTPEVNFFPPEHMRRLEQLTAEHDAIFILDEIITAFRYAIGGYQCAAGLHPDLTTISKGLANGTALSAVIGRAKVMRAQERTYLGNTFQREATPYSAAIASLDVMSDPRFIPQMHAIGARLMNGLNKVFSNAGVAAAAFSHSAAFHVVFEDEELGRLLYGGLRERGFLAEYGGTHMVSHATSEQDVDEALEAAADLLAEATSKHGPIRNERGSMTMGIWSPIVPFAKRAFGATSKTTTSWWPIARGNRWMGIPSTTI